MKKILSLILALITAFAGIAVFSIPVHAETTVGIYENGMENWGGSPNKGEEDAVTQILFCPSDWDAAHYAAGLPVTIRMRAADGSTDDTFSTAVVTTYNGGSWGICRVEPCLMNPPWIPVKNKRYTATFTFVNVSGVTVTAACPDEYFLDREPIVPEGDPVFIPAYKDMDLSGDGCVTVSDVTVMLNLLEKSSSRHADLNGDGLMTISDASALLSLLEAGIYDPFDLIDLTSAREISDLGGYAEGLRVKTTGELLFSPNLNELRSLIDAGAAYADFIGYLRFTDTEAGYTYTSVIADPVQSKGAWVDFFLQGSGIDCGFCPTAGVTYEVELIVSARRNPGRARFYGLYTFTAADAYTGSVYYDPTLAEPADPNRLYTLTYAAQGHGKVTGQTTQYLHAGESAQTVTAVPDEGYILSKWSDGSTEPVRSGDTVRRNTTITAIFIKEPGPDLPAVYIVTDTGRPILSKEYETATISIVGTTTSEYDMTATMQIKGRGNSSWNGSASQTSYDSKNSYSIKLDKKAQLLGLGTAKSKKWVLNSNKFDLSGLRNWISWDLARRMGNIPFVPDCAWVQLYINGEYRGMYMLCEKIDTGTGRVEVDDSITGTPDKGYLIELDFRGDWSGEEDPYFYVDGYIGSNESLEFVIKSDIEGDQDIAFIKEYVQNAHNAIMSGNRTEIEKWVDLPSLIDMYIIEELSKDVDAGRASFYICKDAGGKIFFTAPWDFDFGYGTFGSATSTSGLVSQGNNCCTWYASLITRSWFRQAVLNRMNELASAKDETLAALRDKADELRTGADRNAEFWNMYGRNYHGNVSGQVSSALHSYDEHIDFLVNWVNTRWTALYNVLQNY